MADEPTCAACKQTAASKDLPSLKLCVKCKSARYCSRECQKADWKVHKKACAQKAGDSSSTSQSSGSSAPRLQNLEYHVPNPFTRIDNGMYLHDRPEKDVYKLLIDSFRMREADDFNFENKKAPRSVYTGSSTSVDPFRAYVSKANARGLLPSWWTATSTSKCITYSESGAWSDLRKKLAKQDVLQHYGDDKAPMQLRMFAETVYGSGTMGQDGRGIRKMLMGMEGGGDKDLHSSTIDVSRMGRG